MSMTPEQIEDHMNFWAPLWWPKSEAVCEELNRTSDIMHGAALMAIRLGEPELANEYAFLSNVANWRKYVI